METSGGNFTYAYDLEDGTLYYWFGDKGPDNFSRGTLSNDDNTIKGRWQWPEGDGKTGGYEYTATRVE